MSAHSIGKNGEQNPKPALSDVRQVGKRRLAQTGTASIRRLSALVGAGRAVIIGKARPAIDALGKHTGGHTPKKARNKKGRK